MARLVISKSPHNSKFTEAISNEQADDDYSDRLLKYIPSETVALFALTDKMVTSRFGLDSTASTIADAPSGALVFSLTVFLLGLIFTPIYLRQRRLPNQPWGVHAFISTIAYVFWAYTLGGSLFLLLGWYQTFLAGFLAPIFTFVAGIFPPGPENA